ncbi:MAG TPA: SpoIID/LytB domain-containing protein, partial [Nonomuraea sp.]|nr:SpoIID/LytB domain-containing protein [Nonomuraea sp.]
LGYAMWLVAALVAPAIATAQAGQLAPSLTTERLRFEPAPGTTGLTVAGVGTYRGAIEIARTPAGIAVVNEVGFEDYVKGISEVPNAWPIEALKAQAVAARTYALWEFKRQGAGAYRDAGAHICATQACQVYTGLTKERSENGNRWTAAVEATRSQVLWWKNGPIVAKYSSSNGGESVPGGQPYLRAIKDPDDAHSPLHTWRVTLDPGQLAAAVGLAPRTVTAIQRVGDAVLITAMHDPASAEEEPAHLTIDALDFRDRVNTNIPAPEPLPRTLPTVRFSTAMAPDNGAVVVDGRGWGHGIGLSQWGAFGKATRGMKAPDILASYYAGLRPVEVPVPHVPETIKVAVALDAGPTTVGPSDDGGRMRVVNLATGEVISHGDVHAWTLGPAKNGITGAANPADAAPATVVVADGERTSFAPGEAIEIRTVLTEAASFTATATPPGPAAAPVPVGETKVFQAGDVVVTLPAAATPGPYQVVIQTDRGGGRVGTSTLTLEVADPAATAPGSSPAGGQGPGELTAEAGASPIDLTRPPAAAILALAALATVAAATTRTARLALGRNRPSPLH